MPLGWLGGSCAGLTQLELGRVNRGFSTCTEPAEEEGACERLTLSQALG